MKTELDLPPDFGKFYVNMFGEGVGYVNSNLIISNFIQIDCISYLSFCDCYWDDVQYILLMEYNTMHVAELLKFMGNKKFQDLLVEKYFFKNKGITSSDFNDTPFEEFFDSPIEVMVESIPGDEIFYIGNKPFRKFEVTKFSFPKVLNLKKRKKRSRDS